MKKEMEIVSTSPSSSLPSPQDDSSSLKMTSLLSDILEDEEAAGGSNLNANNPQLPSYASLVRHVSSYHHYEDMCNGHLHRALVYRLSLGLISMESFSTWGDVFMRLGEEYEDMKRVGRDSLIDEEYHRKVSEYQAVKISGGRKEREDEKKVDEKKEEKENEGVFDIHNDCIKRQLILKDMQRLFINGVENEYFQTDERRRILENVLCVWSANNLSLGYKQGMHEIASVVLLVVENECDLMHQWFGDRVEDGLAPPPPPAHSLHDKSYLEVNPAWFRKDDVEMHTYWLFARIMKSLEVIFRNAGESDEGAEESTEFPSGTITEFLHYIQDYVLRALHPKLWEHLKICNIDPQMYGTSWTRLMFGRIFLCNESEQLALWDYILTTPITSFPKSPYVRQYIPLGPVESHYFTVDEESAIPNLQCNQFGLTDTFQNAGDDEEGDDSSDFRESGSSGGWRLGKPFGANQKATVSGANEDFDSESDGDAGGGGEVGSSSRLKNRDDKVDSPKEKPPQVNVLKKNSSSGDVTEVNDDEGENETDREEREKLWRDAGDDGSDEEGDSDFFADNSQPTSREISGESSTMVLWPFAGNDILLKIGSMCVAILFKMRESLLRSSEIGSITLLLHPFENCRDRSHSNFLNEIVFELIRTSQQLESFISSSCTVQPIPLHSISDIMDFHNIRSATYSLERLGAPTWRDASMSVRTARIMSGEEAEKGWFLGKYLGKIVSGRGRNENPSSFESVDNKMKRKKQLLKDYYSEYTSSDGFSSEFSIMSDLPLLMGWLRKRKPSIGPVINKWKRRYIVLTRDCLSYFTDDTYRELRGRFYLSHDTQAVVEDGTKEKHRIKFAIQDPNSRQKVRFFLAESDEMRKKWVERVNKAVELLKHAYDEENKAVIAGSSSSKGMDESDEEEDVFEFSVETSFCRNILVADDLKKYHYASGWLKKKNLIGGNWRLLFFEIVKEEILYYSETSSVAAKTPLGRIPITPNLAILNRSMGKTKHKFALSSEANSKKMPFQTADLVVKKVFHFAARSEEEKEQWMVAIRDAVEATKKR